MQLTLLLYVCQWSYPPSPFTAVPGSSTKRIYVRCLTTPSCYSTRFYILSVTTSIPCGLFDCSISLSNVTIVMNMSRYQRVRSLRVYTPGCRQYVAINPHGFPATSLLSFLSLKSTNCIVRNHIGPMRKFEVSRIAGIALGTSMTTDSAGPGQGIAGRRRVVKNTTRSCIRTSQLFWSNTNRGGAAQRADLASAAFGSDVVYLSPQNVLNDYRGTERQKTV